MDTIRVESDGDTFDVSRGADGRVYLMIENAKVSGCREFVLSDTAAARLSKALYAASFDDFPAD